MKDQNTIQSEPLPTGLTVKIHSLKSSGSTLATASVDLNGVFAIRGVKVMKGSKGPFVSMPGYKTQNGYKDICFPCTKEFRAQFNDAVLNAYRRELVQVQGLQQEKSTSPVMGGMSM